MPRSKRERKVTLSKTAKKGRDRKEEIMQEVRQCVDSYSSIMVFTADNMRNTALKDVRALLRDSRIFFGRNKLMAAAMGRSASDEYRDGLSEVANLLLGGEAGLIFTNASLESVQQCLESTQARRAVGNGAPGTGERLFASSGS